MANSAPKPSSVPLCLCGYSPALAVVTALTLLALAVPGRGQTGPGGLIERLKTTRLQQVQRDVRALRAAAQPEAKSAGFLDVRAAFHVHSRLSHDSRGTPEEIVAGAKKAGVRVLFMTEHPTAERRWVTEQVRGEHDGVFFIPGAELSDGLMVFRSDTIAWEPGDKTATVLAKLNADGGIGILCHPEQRTEWNLPFFTGMEIYNTHADVEDNLKAGGDVLDRPGPAELLTMLLAFRQYPVEAFAALFDPPTGNLKRWDALCRERPVTGVAGNDSHANTGIVATVEGEKLVITNPLGRKLTEVDAKAVPPFLLGVDSFKPGAKVLDVRFDPYEVSLGYVNTHLLAREVTEPDLFEAVKRGRAYVAFDWLSDPSGFSFTGEKGHQKGSMGDELPAGARLTARASAPATLRLLRDGEEIARATGRELAAEAPRAGVYRVEVSLPVGGDDRPWIYSNPIYVR